MRAVLAVMTTAMLVAGSSRWATATVRTTRYTPEQRLAVPAMESTEREMRESLQKDMVRHPADFISFPTETGAIQFMKEHSMDTSRETVPRMIELGVVGYWQGRTLVVLPIAPPLMR